MIHFDSTGNVIVEGNQVRFRGKIYTIEKFIDGAGRLDTAQIEFIEEQHTLEVADEISVDLT